VHPDCANGEDLVKENSVGVIFDKPTKHILRVY
jgi:hypothetical protein